MYWCLPFLLALGFVSLANSITEPNLLLSDGLSNFPINEVEPSSVSLFDDGFSSSVLENDTPDLNLNILQDDGLLSFDVNEPQPGSTLLFNDFSSPVSSQAESNSNLLFNDNSWSIHLDNSKPDPGLLFSEDDVNQSLLNKAISDNTDIMINECPPTSMMPRRIRARGDSCVNLDPKISIPTAEDNMNEQIRRRWCYAAPFGAFNTIAVCKRDTPAPMPSESSLDPPEPVVSEFLNIPRCWLMTFMIECRDTHVYCCNSFLPNIAPRAPSLPPPPPPPRGMVGGRGFWCLRARPDPLPS